MGDTLTATSSLSPLSRKNVGKKGNPTFTFDDIELLYQGAIKLLYYFTEAYRIAIAPFKDGNAHAVDSGWIIWDSEAGWLWKGTDEDGLTDYDEINIYGTNPNDPDTDGDGINDGDEVEFWGYDWDMDFDNDGIINLLDSDVVGYMVFAFIE